MGSGTETAGQGRRGPKVRRRLDEGRREELLDGVMQIIADRGFSRVGTAEMAKQLHCSESTLYKIAPSKDSLVLLAIGRWGERTLAEIDAEAEDGRTASERARRYFRAGAARLHPLTLTFFADIERFESTRAFWRSTVVDRYIDRFVELVRLAEQAGEIRAVNVAFFAEVLRRIGFVTRDDRVLAASGLTSEAAVFEVDRLIWEGIAETGGQG
jgi:AcrR family transcriptional regulator